MGIMGSYFVKGLMTAIIFGVPAGVIGVLTINRTLNGGFWTGFLTGMGSSVADVIYASVGAFGIGILSGFFIEHQRIISITGSFIVCLLGFSIFCKKAGEQKAEEKILKPYACFFSSFAAAILNPSTFLSFILAFSTLHIAEDLRIFEAVGLVGGVFVGTCVWWLVLVGLVLLFKKYISVNIYRILNKCLGSLLILFGIITIVRA